MTRYRVYIPVRLEIEFDCNDEDNLREELEAGIEQLEITGPSSIKSVLFGVGEGTVEYERIQDWRKLLNEFDWQTLHEHES